MYRLIVLVLVFANVATAENPSSIKRADDAPKPLSPRESAKRVRLPDGFRLDLIASEPLVEEPSCLAFDEFGRLFVCELHGYNVEGEIDVAELNKSGKLDTEVRRIRWELKGGEIAEQAAVRQFGKLKLLIDSNNDGLMDKAEIWADDLPPCYGVVPARGGVIVTCAPDIVFLADTDGDHKPDVREVLFTGFQVEVLERGVNNPRWGVDNWIYVGSGGRGGTITGPHLPKPVEIGSNDFRIRPDGTAIEPVNGSVGTFGMTMNEAGDRFPASGGQPANYSLPLPYRYLARNPHVPTPGTTLSAVNYNQGFRISAPHPWRVERRKDPKWIKFYGDRETNSNYFSGGCSNEVYDDALFPAACKGNLFYCEPSLNIIHRCVIERDGAGYRGRRAKGEEQSEFLASTDQWFRPMNLRVGPHGGLYIVDMYREIIEDYSAIPRFLQQQYGLDQGRDRGRIWRLAPEDDQSSPAPNLSRLSENELVDVAADSSSRWNRNTARRLLIERNATSTVASIRQLLREAKSHSVATNLAYTLDGLNSLDEQSVRKLLAHPDFAARMHGLRFAERFDRLADEIAKRLDDKDPSVRIQAALSLGQTKFGHPSLWDTQIDHPFISYINKHGDERWVQTAILSSSRQIADQLLLRLLQNPTDVEKKYLLPLAATVAGEADGVAASSVLDAVSSLTPEIQQLCLTGLSKGIRSRIMLSKSAIGELELLTESNSEEVRSVAIKVTDQIEKQSKKTDNAPLFLASVNPTATVTREQLARYRRALDAPREPKRGKAIFVKHCSACHRLDGVGHAVGPDLATIANRPDEVVLMDILNPNDRVEPEYLSYSVLTVEGKTYTGVLQSETPTSLILLLEKGEKRTILRRDIELSSPTNISLMPTDLHKSITPADLANLLSYIRSVLSGS